MRPSNKSKEGTKIENQMSSVHWKKKKKKNSEGLNLNPSPIVLTALIYLSFWVA